MCGGIDEDVFGANKRKWEVSLLEAARGVFSRYAWTAIRLYAMFVFVGGDTSRVTAAL